LFVDRTVEKGGAEFVMLETKEGQLARLHPMQDWLLVIAPLATVLYFVEFPGQFMEIVNWLTRYMQ
jgi:hypothetical protein